MESDTNNIDPEVIARRTTSDTIQPGYDTNDGDIKIRLYIKR